MADEAGVGGSGGQQEDGGTGGTAGQAGSDGSGGSADSGPVDPSGDCPKGLKGPALVELSTPNGQKYCMDATEVTWMQYHAFKLAKASNMSGQPPECDWNDSYENVDPDHNCDVTTAVDGPVYCTDWCDAFAYCAWAGKHLCGKIGGGTLLFDNASDANSSEWYNACSNGGKTAYPYGDAYDEDVCVTWQNPTLGGEEFPMDVASLPACRGVEPPFTNIFDLSGNAAEWVDACEGTMCEYRGGSWQLLQKSQAPDCGNSEQVYRQVSNGGIGFRCCAAIEQ